MSRQEAGETILLQAKAAPRQQSVSKTPGICTNIANCAVARSNRPVMVALKQPFRCPSCGSPLTPPDPTQMRRGLVMPLLAGGAALLLLVLAVLWLIRPEAAQHAAVPQSPAEPVPAAQPVQTAAVAASAPPPVGADQLGTSPPSHDVVGSSGPGGPTSPTLALAHPGQPAAEHAPPEPAAPPPPAAAKAAAPAAEASASKAAAVKRQHRVVAARAKARLQGEATGEMLPTDGSRPEYPTEYEDDGEQGTVAVTCIILPNGHATGCRVNARTGGPRFAVSVQRWLDRDATRFPPMVRNGRAAPARFTWNIQFFP